MRTIGATRLPIESHAGWCTQISCSPFPKQHHPKLGMEHVIDPAPLYDAPFYKGSGKLEGKVARKRAQGKVCPATEGIIEEGEEIMDEFKGMPALDAGLVSDAQAVEHYEIARYGTLNRWAEELGMKDVAKLLGETLAEESATDKSLTALA